MIKLWKPICLTLLLLMFSAPAFAQRCLPRDAAVENLKQKYHEVVVGIGTAGDGSYIGELWLSENKSWTFLITRTNKLSCVVASGKGWEGAEIKLNLPARFFPIASNKTLENRTCRIETIEESLAKAPEVFHEIDLSPSEAATLLNNYRGRNNIDEVHVFIAPTPAGQEMGVLLFGAAGCTSFSMFRDISWIEGALGRSVM